MNNITVLVDKKQLAEYVTTGKIPTTWVRYDGSSTYSENLLEYTTSEDKLLAWRGMTNEQVVGPKILLKG